MKKFLLTAVIVFVTAGLSLAQEQGEIRLGASLALGSEAGLNDSGSTFGVGINLGGEYFFTDIISGNISYTYFLKSSIGEEGNQFSTRLSSFNIDGRYYFMTDDIQVYGLAGLAFLGAKSTNEYTYQEYNPVTQQLEEVSGTTKAKGSDTGLNIGAGIVMPLSDGIGFNGQLKYQTPGSGQLVVNAGIVYSLEY